MSVDVSDPFVRDLRREISDVDTALVELVNKRLRLVAKLKRYKDEHGIAFVDPNREAQMIADRLRENAGPLSEDGLRAFYSELLALIKREV